MRCLIREDLREKLPFFERRQRRSQLSDRDSVSAPPQPRRGVPCRAAGNGGRTPALWFPRSLGARWPGAAPHRASWCTGNLPGLPGTGTACRVLPVHGRLIVQYERYGHPQRMPFRSRPGLCAHHSVRRSTAARPHRGTDDQLDHQRPGQRLRHAVDPARPGRHHPRPLPPQATAPKCVSRSAATTLSRWPKEPLDYAKPCSLVASK